MSEWYKEFKKEKGITLTLEKQKEDSYSQFLDKHEEKLIFTDERQPINYRLEDGKILRSHIINGKTEKFERLSSENTTALLSIIQEHCSKTTRTRSYECQHQILEEFFRYIHKDRLVVTKDILGLFQCLGYSIGRTCFRTFCFYKKWYRHTHGYVRELKKEAVKTPEFFHGRYLPKVIILRDGTEISTEKLPFKRSQEVE